MGIAWLLIPTKSLCFFNSPNVSSMPWIGIINALDRYSQCLGIGLLNALGRSYQFFGQVLSMPWIGLINALDRSYQCVGQVLSMPGISLINAIDRAYQCLGQVLSMLWIGLFLYKTYQLYSYTNLKQLLYDDQWVKLLLDLFLKQFLLFQMKVTI